MSQPAVIDVEEHPARKCAIAISENFLKIVVPLWGSLFQLHIPVTMKWFGDLWKRNGLQVWLCSYNAGDVLMVQPHNMSDTVSSFVSLLHLSPDSLVTLKSASPGELLIFLIHISIFRIYMLRMLEVFCTKSIDFKLS